MLLFDVEKSKCFSDYEYVAGSLLLDVSHINIFVGPNNSGKSRFMREIFKFRPRVYNLSGQTNEVKTLFINCINKCKTILSEINKINPKLYEDIKPETIENISENDFTTSLDVVSLVYKDIYRYAKVQDFSIYKGQQTGQIKTLLDTLKNKSEYFIKRFENLPGNVDDFGAFYIPVLRGMRPLFLFKPTSVSTRQTIVKDKDNNNDIIVPQPYLYRTIYDYFNDSKLSIEKKIFTGISIYEDLKEQLLGKQEQRERVKEFEKFLENNFFDEPVTLIPEHGKDTVAVQIGEEPQLPIYDLGDGLQQLIILLFKIFTADRKSIFFIEEPDLYMHPGMQRKFLNVLQKYSNKHYFFLTTHSNHLLDMTLDYGDISIFHFSKNVNKNPKFNVASLLPSDFEILKSLGVYNSSVFRTNATIWVEGITDRRYIREYFRKYISSQKLKYEEDTHYSFVEYQGTNLIHWSFNDTPSDNYRVNALRMTAPGFLVADNDVRKNEKKIDFIERMFGDQKYYTPGKEIENMIPEALLNRYLKNNYKEFYVELKYKEYSEIETGLAKYIDEKFKKTHFAEESGTFKSHLKGKLCEGIVKLMQEEDFEINKDIKNLCTGLYNFIREHNPG